MDIKVTKKQNVKVDGVKYKAVLGDSCIGCAFDRGPHFEVCGPAPCQARSRDDGREVIFVKKVTKWLPADGVKPADLAPNTRIVWKDARGDVLKDKYGVRAGSLNWAGCSDDKVIGYRIVKAEA